MIQLGLPPSLARVTPRSPDRSLRTSTCNSSLDRQRVIASRIPQEIRHRYSRRAIVSQAIILEDVLYRNASTYEGYADRRTLERRAVKAAAAYMTVFYPYFGAEW